MKNLEYEEIMEILDEYKIKYTSLNCKGDVDFGLEEIRINPVYNQDVQTLFHEFAHIYYEDLLEQELTEDIIEYESQNYLKNNKSAYKVFDCYLESRTERIEYEIDYKYLKRTNDI